MENIGKRAQWIWQDANRYPELQHNQQKLLFNGKIGKDGVAEFRKTVKLSAIPEKVTIYVSGDALFRLWVNDRFMGQGPASAGGDFLMDGPLPWHYANEYVLLPSESELCFRAQVRLQPQVLTDVTGGHGGFWLWGIAEYADGTSETFGTDHSWQTRLDRRFVEPFVYDASKEPETWEAASPTGDARCLQVAPVPPICYEKILPLKPACQIHLRSGESLQVEFDRIYSAHFALHCDTPCHLRITYFETLDVCSGREELTLHGGEEYRSLYMNSIGMVQIEVLDASGEIKIEPYLYFSHYPVESEGYMRTSDGELDAVYDVCKWTLKICRQSMHLDSPKHQELLACSSDYYIQTMMTAFTFGDMRLAALDVYRTARWLAHNDGRMFHTNYSLIWVQWLHFVWQYTADTSLVENCRQGLTRLLERFHSYIGNRGVLENAPDYMFVDWVVLDGYSMHHPPKSMGQTVLNAFYYKALIDAADLACRLGWAEADVWKERANSLHKAFHPCFYDESARMYIGGLNDPDVETPWKPANPSTKHFSRYANTLAVLYDLCPPAEAIRLTKLVADEQTNFPPVQPYFMHFVLQAVCHVGLIEEYGLSLFEPWKPLVQACPKGLQEGWLAPEPTYSFDHSHAWGGTPAYHLPAILSGFKMLEPGFKKISLSPQLFGLSYADIAFPTPYGMLRCVQREGQPPQIVAPEGLNWELV